MPTNTLQERLINGFSRFGYELHSSNYTGSEFRKATSALRFVVMPAEGGVMLLSTESPAHDLINSKLIDIYRNLRPEVDIRSFCGSPDEFWQAVGEIIEGKCHEA